MYQAKEFHQFSNIKKMVELSRVFWDEAQSKGVIGLNCVPIEKNRYRLESGHEFLHFCSCSYLGLDSHPDLINGAIEAIKEQKTTSWIATSRNRLKLLALEELEEKFSKFFKASALTSTTCSAASAAILPLLAAGLFTNNRPPLMIFDKSAHFSMNFMKALCADETEVTSCAPNDMNFIEEMCKQHEVVAYVGDGVNSVGGFVPIHELLALQKKYNLFLYIDDSHSLSSYGDKGYGYVRSAVDEINENMIIVASLAKAFGTSGGLIMLGSEDQKQLITRYGGPNLWSQGMNICAVGSSMASLKLHETPELYSLQKKLSENIQLFDSLIETEYKGNPFTIRIVRTGEADKAVDICRYLLDEGFYTSSVFFPIVGKGKAGLRLMLRADMESSDITRLANLINSVRGEGNE